MKKSTQHLLLISGGLAIVYYFMKNSNPMTPTSIGAGGSTVDIQNLPSSVQAGVVQAMQDAASVGVQF